MTGMTPAQKAWLLRELINFIRVFYKITSRDLQKSRISYILDKRRTFKVFVNLGEGYSWQNLHKQMVTKPTFPVWGWSHASFCLTSPDAYFETTIIERGDGGGVHPRGFVIFLPIVENYERRTPLIPIKARQIHIQSRTSRTTTVASASDFWRFSSTVWNCLLSESFLAFGVLIDITKSNDSGRLTQSTISGARSSLPLVAVILYIAIIYGGITYSQENSTLHFS